MPQRYLAVILYTKYIIVFTLGFIIYLSIIATGSAISLIKYKKNDGIKPVAILLIITLLSEIISRVLAFYFENSNPTYHLLNPSQTILWCYFFSFHISSNIKKTIIITLSILLVVYSIYDSVFSTGILKFPATFLSIQSIVLICFGFILFFEKLDEPAEKNIFQDPVFIICLAVIWFYLISFLFFNFHQFSLSKKVSRSTLKIINYASNYVYYLLLLFAVILNTFFDKPQHQNDVN